MRQLAGRVVRVAFVARRKGVVVEGDAVDDGHEEERPVRAAGRLRGVAVVVDGEEYVRCFAEVREGVADGGGVGGLH